MWRFLIFPVPEITVHKNSGWDIDNMKLETLDFFIGNVVKNLCPNVSERA